MKAFNFIFAFGIPVVTAVMFFSRPIVLILLGIQYRDAQTDLILLAPLILVISLSNILAMNVLTPRNKENLFLRATVLGMLVSLVLMFILMPYFYDKGAAITLLITEIVVCISLLYFSYKYIHALAFDVKIIAFTLLNSIIIFGAASRLLNLIPLPLFYRFALIGSGSFIAYILIQIFVVKDVLLIDLLATVKLKLKNGKR